MYLIVDIYLQFIFENDLIKSHNKTSEPNKIIYYTLSINISEGYYRGCTSNATND